MNEIIKINGYDIPFEINYNNRVKYIRMSISSDGIKISSRKGVNKGIIKDFINKKSNWIIENYIRLKRQNDKNEEMGWFNTNQLLYRGENYKVIIVGSNVKKCIVNFDNDLFKILVPYKMDEENRKSVIEKELIQWYKNEAKKIITEKVLLYSKKMSVIYNHVRIKEQKTRWGSCSTKKNLNFNWKIIMAEDTVIDYVIIHELCHLVHFNHSKEFWNLVRLYMPDYKVQAAWLKNKGATLFI